MIVLVDACSVLVNIAYAGEPHLITLSSVSEAAHDARTVFAALRMFALYDMEKLVFAVVLAVGLFNPCAQIVRFLRRLQKAFAGWKFVPSAGLDVHAQT